VATLWAMVALAAMAGVSEALRLQLSDWLLQGLVHRVRRDRQLRIV